MLSTNKRLWLLSLAVMTKVSALNTSSTIRSALRDHFFSEEYSGIASTASSVSPRPKPWGGEGVEYLLIDDHAILLLELLT